MRKQRFVLRPSLVARRGNPRQLMKAAIAAGILLALAACAGPAIEAFNDRGGVISYHLVNSNLGDVLATAERYCSGFGRKAKLGTPSIGWDSMSVSFECVE